jgi:hypothetical protein
MTDRIIDGTNIDTSVFSYSAPKAHASGGKVVNLYNKNFKDSLTISTPLIMTWGAQEGKDQQGNTTGKYTMSLQFPNSDYPNAECDEFLTQMRKLEAKVKEDAMTYSKEWFGKTITSSEVMDEKFNIMLRHPKIKGTQELDLSKPPTLMVKIPCWSGTWKSEIYDEEGEPLYINGKVNNHLSPLDYLKSKTHVINLIQCGGLWFVNGKVSITWNLKQAIVQKPKQEMEGRCFIVPKTKDKERMKALVPQEDEELGECVVEDSDSDSEGEDDEPVDVPVVVPVDVPVVVPVDVPVVVPVVETVVAPVSDTVVVKKKVLLKKKA